VAANEIAVFNVGALIVLPGDVAALQKQISADRELLRSALIRCAQADKFSPEKTPADWEAWQSLKQRADDYIAEEPQFLTSASQFERGEAIQKELAAFHDRARALGCDVAVAPTLPSSSGPLDALFAGISTSALLLLLVVLAFKHK
jgi:hypothetical protein